MGEESDVSVSGIGSLELNMVWKTNHILPSCGILQKSKSMSRALHRNKLS